MKISFWMSALASLVVTSSLGCGAAPGDDEAVGATEGTGAGGITSSLPIGSILKTTGNLNLRTGPGTTHSIIEVMSTGTEVTTVNTTTPVNGFYNVSDSGTVGWASGKYLKLVRAGSNDAGAGDSGSGKDAGGGNDAGSGGDGGMKNWTPTAKGLWIWYFDYVGMSAAQAASTAQAAGVGYVLIKSGQDGSFWSSRYTASAVQEFMSRGMRVLAWP